ncbi:hypothetical protein [Corynebacterium matruchotii]|uniref:hypothetical protein n=1 Tax=Corynebacterium matruchotii TaxID=43768 RepID=UPI003C6F2012
MYASFPPELNTVFDAGLAKYGPVELAKRFMFHYMRENGVTYGDAWQCVIELSESSFEDPTYIRKVEQFYAKYAEIMNEESAATVEENIRFRAKHNVLRGIICGLEVPISELPYNAIYNVWSLYWDEERIQNSFAELDHETGIPDFPPPAITFSTPIASLDDARKAVAARKDLDRPLALFDTWGFESPTQFLVVAIPFQDWPIPPYNCIVDKTDGKAYTTDLKNTDIFAHFGKNGVRVVSMTGKDKVLWHEWSRTMLETLPPYPGESY